MHDVSLVTVGVFGSRHEAHIARARLESSGLDAFIQADDAGGYEPQLGLTNGVRLLVHARFVALALETLDPPGEGGRAHRASLWTRSVAALLASVLIGLVGLPLLVTLWRVLTL